MLIRIRIVPEDPIRLRSPGSDPNPVLFSPESRIQSPARIHNCGGPRAGQAHHRAAEHNADDQGDRRGAPGMVCIQTDNMIYRNSSMLLNKEDIMIFISIFASSKQDFIRLHSVSILKTNCVHKAYGLNEL